MLKKTFPHIDGDSFSAYRAAEAWCQEQGYSVGSMQRGAPTLIYYGDCDVAKYRNISPAERKSAIGTIEGVGGRFRDGPVTVTVKNVKPV
jgi:hypothetical protein